MQCSVYKTNKSLTYLIVEEEKNLQELPSNISASINDKPFKKIDLNSERPLIGLNKEDALKCINENGYYEASVKISSEERKMSEEHFEIEEGLEKIAIYSDENTSEMRMLEVTSDTFSSGTVDAFSFAPDTKNEKQIVIADITPDEWEKVQAGSMSLPEEWGKNEGTLKIISKEDFAQ